MVVVNEETICWSKSSVLFSVEEESLLADFSADKHTHAKRERKEGI